MEKKLKTTMPGYISNLPIHILQIIFCKLPNTTLIECRHVCESWCHILSDPDFNKLLILSTREPSKLLMCLEGGLYGDQYLHWVECQGESRYFHSAAKQRWASSSVFESLCLVNSCNGLFLYSFWHAGKPFCPFTLRVMNPVTAEYLELPPILEGVGYSDNVSCGLGYVSSTNQFKAIRIYKGSGKRHRILMAEVRILGIGAWRKIIGQVPRGYQGWKSFNAFVNGSCHWLVEEDRDVKICAFDFESERFTSISLPQDVQWYDFHVIDLGVFGESLFCSKNHRCVFSEIWVMNEHGKEKSWCKRIEIYHHTIKPWCLRRQCYFEVISILETWDVVLLCDEIPLLYNPETKTCKKLDTHGTISRIDKAFVHMKPNFSSFKYIVGVDETGGF